MVVSDSNFSEILRRGKGYANESLGTVNGTDILRKDFDARVKEAADQQRAGNPDAEIDEETLRQQVWDQMVEETILAQEAKKAGITVTADQIQDIMLDNPPDYLRKDFTDSTGKFNREQYLKVVTDPESIGENIRQLIQAGKIQAGQVDPDSEVVKIKRGLLKIEDFIKKNQLSESMRSLISMPASLTSPLYIKHKYVADNSTADVNYISFDVSKVADKEVNVTDEEINAYYEKNKQYFKQKPTRKLKYVSFQLVPSSADTNNLGRRIAKIQAEFESATTPEQKDNAFDLNFANFSGKTNDFTPLKQIDMVRLPLLENAKPHDIIGPVKLADGTYFFRVDSLRTGEKELVHASHILISFGANKDSAKTFAEKVYKRAKSGEDFAQLASQYSADKSNAATGGDLKFFGKGQMVKQFEDAAFAASAGSIVGPVETQFGFHIINVKEKTSEEIKYSEIKFSVSISGGTRNMLKRDAISFKEQIAAGKQFDTLAKQLKKNSVETVFFEKTTPVLGSRTLTDFAFENEVGTVSNPMEIKRFGIVVVQVSDVRQPGVKPLVDMKDEIKERLKRIKKLDILKAKAESVYSKIKDKSIIASVSEVDPTLDVRTAAKIRDNGQIMGLGAEPAFTTVAMTSPVGKIVGPIRGEKGYFIIQVTDKQAADESKFAAQADILQKSMAQQGKSNAYYQWLATQKEQATIEDNRSKYYREN